MEPYVFEQEEVETDVEVRQSQHPLVFAFAHYALASDVRSLDFLFVVVVSPTCSVSGVRC